MTMQSLVPKYYSTSIFVELLLFVSIHVDNEHFLLNIHDWYAVSFVVKVGYHVNQWNEIAFA